MVILGAATTATNPQVKFIKFHRFTERTELTERIRDGRRAIEETL
jgi:hypothetical protein